jgi:hypothetical protein
MDELFPMCFPEENVLFGNVGYWMEDNTFEFPLSYQCLDRGDW